MNCLYIAYDVYMFCTTYEIHRIKAKLPACVVFLWKKEL